MRNLQLPSTPRQVSSCLDPTPNTLPEALTADTLDGCGSGLVAKNLSLKRIHRTHKKYSKV